MNRLRLLTVLVVALGALALFTLAGTAHADLMYQFDVHETTSLGFQPFSFSFTVPTFVTAGQSPAFTPFTVTFGTHSYKMINDLAGTFPGGIGCFMFDTGGPAFIDPSCNIGASTTDGNGALKLVTVDGLPTATGMQTFGPFSLGYLVLVVGQFPSSPPFVAPSILLLSLLCLNPQASLS
jgi:hypothetical protein